MADNKSEFWTPAEESLAIAVMDEIDRQSDSLIRDITVSLGLAGQSVTNEEVGQALYQHLSTSRVRLQAMVAAAIPADTDHRRRNLGMEVLTAMTGGRVTIDDEHLLAI